MYGKIDAHQDAMMAARGSSMEDNLAYLQANIGYFLGLDSGQPGQRLAEILATMVSSTNPWSAPCLDAINTFYQQIYAKSQKSSAPKIFVVSPACRVYFVTDTDVVASSLSLNADTRRI